jgi:hypothetical protein
MDVGFSTRDSWRWKERLSLGLYSTVQDPKLRNFYLPLLLHLPPPSTNNRIPPPEVQTNSKKSLKPTLLTLSATSIHNKQDYPASQVYQVTQFLHKYYPNSACGSHATLDGATLITATMAKPRKAGSTITCSVSLHTSS